MPFFSNASIMAAKSGAVSGSTAAHLTLQSKESFGAVGDAS